MNLSELNVKVFADGADKAAMMELYNNPIVQGFTTNPTLMRQAGVSDYRAFAHDVLQVIYDRPISFEVFSDDFDEMEEQALEIASWADNVYVKIPITNTLGEPSNRLISKLAAAGVQLNVTAILTLEQVRSVIPCLADGPSCYVSLFAGRLADTGRDPLPVMKSAVDMLKAHSNIELIWASPRELLNVFHANSVGCHVITVTCDVLRKMELIGKDLTEYSLDTVKMFRSDALKAGYSLKSRTAATSGA